jgi:hypothetical protein
VTRFLHRLSNILESLVAKRLHQTLPSLPRVPLPQYLDMLRNGRITTHSLPGFVVGHLRLPALAIMEADDR